MSWFIIVDRETNLPFGALDADGFIRDLFATSEGISKQEFSPHDHIYRVGVYRDPQTRLGEVLRGFQVVPNDDKDDVIDVDVALIWTDDNRRIITGADCFGRLMRGIARNRHWRIQRSERKYARKDSELET